MRGCGRRTIWRFIPLYIIGTCIALLALGFTHQMITATIDRRERTTGTALTSGLSLLRQLTAQVHQPRDFRPGEVPQLLILSYQRCGSSFFGHVFGGHEDVFYAYEPLDGLYVSLYGTQMGWNVPADITSYANGTERIVPEMERVAVTNFLDDMFNCRAENLPPESVYHNFWGQFGKEHSSLDPFKTCVKISSIKLDRCLRQLPKKCHARFDPGRSTLEYCHQGMARTHNGTDQNDAFRNYHDCVEDFSTKFNCNRIFRNLCTRGGFRGIKTVRGTMASVGDLLERNPNLKVIHLIRDPRAVVLSRQHFHKSGQGLYSASEDMDEGPEQALRRPQSQVDQTGKTAVTEPKKKKQTKVKTHFDLAKEAKLYCSSVVRDLLMRKELEKKYPGVLVEVIYDDFVQAPLDYAAKLYDFIGVDMGNKTRTWLLSQTSQTEGKRNASYISHKWQSELTFLQSKQIDSNCARFYQEISYQFPK